MNQLPQQSHVEGGDFVKTAVMPASVLAKPHLDALDGVIVLLFGLSTGGLIYWIFG